MLTSTANASLRDVLIWKFAVITRLFCAFLVSSILQLSLAAFANTIAYVPPTADQSGKFTGVLPLRRLGSVLLPKGMVKFDGDEIKILAVPQWLFDRNVVFRGALIRAEFAPQQASGLVAGLVYFWDGLWLANLSSDKVEEEIETMTGETLQGKVIGRIGTSLSMKLKDGSTKNIEFATIKSIDSPRAFTFNIPAAGVKIDPADGAITFDATIINVAQMRVLHKLIASNSIKVPKSNLPGTEPGISKKALALMFAMDVTIDIAPAIVVPLVINHGTQQGALNRLRSAGNEALVNGNAPPPTPPVYAPFNLVKK
jgi:hypothetical protein